MSDTPKINKREKQRIDRKEQILQCSLDMMISRGYEAMKIRDIAKELHISTGLFFNYFESKEKVYEELVKIGISGPRNVFKMDTDGIEPIAFFERMTEVIFESLKTCTITAKIFVLMAQVTRSKTNPESITKLIDQFDAITPTVSVILEGQKLGQIKNGDPVALAIAYWGAVQGVAENFAIWPDLPLPKTDWLVDILRA